MAITIPILSEFNDRGIQQAEGAFKKLGDIAKTTAKLVAGVGIAAGAAAYKTIDLASDLSESQAKVGEIFGDSATEIEKFAATAATALGQSKQDVLNAAGTFGVFGKAAGLTGTDLSDFSNDFTALASDLASFNNTSPQEAIDAIGAALRGESEPLRRYGVLLDDASLRQAALELGIYDGNGALTAQQKILAAQKRIYEQTGDAQGDFARTSDGLANKQRILKAQLQNAATTIGTVLLPIATKLFTFIGDRLIPIVEKVTRTFSEEGFGGVARMIGDMIPPVLEKLGELGRRLIEWVGEQIPGWLRKLGELGQALVDWIEPRIVPMLKQLGEWAGAAANWIIDEGLPMLVEKLIELGQAFVDWIAPRIVPMLEELGKLAAAILQWIVTEAIPKIAEQALKLAGALLSWLAELIPQAIAGLAVFVWELIQKLPEIFLDLVKAMWDKGKELGGQLLDGIIEFVLDLPSKLWDAFTDTFAALFDIGKKMVDKIVDGIKSVPGRIAKAIGDQAKKGASNLLGIGGVLNIIPFAEGGIVTAPTLGLVGEAGPEAVIPLDKAGMMGNITVNVSGSVIRERDLVETIRRGLVNAQRNGAQLIYSNV